MLDQLLTMKNPNKDIDSLYDAYYQLKKMLLVMMDGGIDYSNLNLDGITSQGFDARKIDRSKNYVRDSSFELDNSPFWSGDGVVTQDANFYGSRSLKLAPTKVHQTNPLTQGDLNPTYWGFFNPTRLSFQKKFGRLKVEVLDYSNNSSPLSLTDEQGNKSNSAIYTYNSNWDSGFCTLTFNPGHSTKLTIKFTNIDDQADAYIDTVDLRPDYTGFPMIYKDGPRSTAYNGVETKAIHVGPNPPTNPEQYDLWVKTGTKLMQMNMNDGYLIGNEIIEPDAPTENKGVLYFRDNGSGKTQLCVRFPTGAIQVIATEP